MNDSYCITLYTSLGNGLSDLEMDLYSVYFSKFGNKGYTSADALR